MSPVENPYAIVVGLDCMTGLQSTRILRSRGIPVIGVAKDLSHPCCKTRWCNRLLQADIDGLGLIECLEALGESLSHKAVLYPCTDLSVLAISRYRDRLVDKFHVIMPPHPAVSILMDKIGFFEYAVDNGFAVPKGVIVRDSGQANEIADQLAMPCVIKPSVKTRTWQANSKAKVYKATSREQLGRIVERCLAWTDRLLVQEWVEGDASNSYTCNCYLTRDGRAVTSYVSRKVRQWPPETGIGCLSVECRNDVVRDEAIRLFESVGYHGLAYVEMKVDDRTGKHFMIEPNVSRPTGRSAMAEAGGVELLYAMYCDALGRPLPASLNQSYSDVKWIHLRQDVRAAWTAWRRGQLSLAAWTRSWKGRKTYAVFSWSDPRPFLSDLGKVFRRAAGRFLRGRDTRHPLPQ